MNSPITTQQELEALNSTLPAGMVAVFSVPDGYFEGFAFSVLSRIRESELVLAKDELADLSPFLANLPRQMPFSVPENYFSSLSNDIPLFTTDHLPSIFLEVNRKNPYIAPMGYFEDLPSAMLKQVTGEKQAKLVSLAPKRWMRMAAAAAVVGLIALASIVYFTGTEGTDLNKLSNNWVSKNLQGISDKDIEEFVQTTGATSLTPATDSPSKTAEVRVMLTDVSDGELDNFLADAPADDDEFIFIN